MTAKEFIQKIPTKVNPEEIAGVSTILHFNLGENEQYSIKVNDGKAEFVEGLVGDAECAIQTKPEEFVKIATGETNPMMAMMMGKLKVQNPGALMKYAKLLGIM